MSNTEKNTEPKSFWETLPGILTALAALVTAIGGCITVFVSWPRPNVFFPATAIPIAITSTPITPVPPVPQSQPRIISSGLVILKGSYTFDLDAGQQGGSSNEADIWWEHVDDTVRYLNAQNGAQFSYLGTVDFEQVSANDLMTANYNEMRLNGSASSANQLMDGTVILVRTNRSNLCKLRIEKYGIAAPGDLPEWPKSALLIRWVAFSAQ